MSLFDWKTLKGRRAVTAGENWVTGRHVSRRWGDAAGWAIELWHLNRFISPVLGDHGRCQASGIRKAPTEPAHLGNKPAGLG